MATTRTHSVILVLVVLTAMLLSPQASTAGTVNDYPEFPYQPTNYAEPFRGQFHFSPRGGWMNDVNAPLYYRGQYHLFFQHNPHSLQWETMHWGHAVSPDLVHWTQKPIALEPGVHPGDLWSGGGVVDTANTSGLKDGTDDPIVVFTGTNGVRVAYSTDGAATFQSYDNGTPVVTPAGTSRDAKVFWHAASGRWVMVVWSDSGGNGVDVYTSPNLLAWTHASRFAASWLYECPDLFPLQVDGDPANTKWVLTDADGDYVVGDFTGTAFSTNWSTPQKIDQGVTAFDNGTFYAGLTFENMPDGRVVQMAWQPSNKGSTWSGNATFPAELGLRTFSEGVRVTRNPVTELASLRTTSSSWSDLTITPSTDPLAGTTADTYEITARFDLTGATATQFGFRLHKHADGTTDRTVAYDTAAHTLYGKPLAPNGTTVTLRLLVDRGQLEIFGNDGQLSISDNVDFDASSLGVSLFSAGGNVKLDSLEFHRLASAWGTGESTLDSSLPAAWHPVGGTWTDVAAGKQGSATGDAFLLNDQTGTDFSYEGDVRVDQGTAAALTFRASADGTQHYTANVDTSGVVKLWRPGQVLASVPTPIVPGRFYHLKVVTTGPRIRVYLDDGATPLIDVTDSTYPSGRFGVNAFNATATVQNLNVNTGGLTTTITGRWTPTSGTWTEPAGHRKGNAAGDGFLLTDQTGTDFTYEGDIRVVNGQAAGLTFRANADGTQHYTATIDKAGLVKLWRPGQDIATHATPIREGKTYHLKVTATGPTIRVYLDGATTPVIDTVDSTYTSGRFGLNTFAATSTFAGVTVS